MQGTSSAPLAAYWLALSGDRAEFQRQLQELIRGDGIVVLVVRQDRFDNPNALMQDLLGLMDANRSTLIREVEACGGPIGLVLLARRDLVLVQCSSPIIWPSWVPGVGGREVLCYITDIGRRIVAPLNCDEAQGWRLNVALLALEEALIRRMTAVHECDVRAGEQFFELIRRRKDPSWGGFLAEAARSAAMVRNDKGFRPNSSAGASVVSRLWRAGQTLGSKELRTLEVGLSNALALQDADLPAVEGGLLTGLSRPDASEGTPSDRFARDIVTSVNLTSQYITCVAHSGEYWSFPDHAHDFGRR